MSNALHDYAKLFERYAANNGGTGAILAGEDCLSLANEMRMDADAIDAENVKLRKLVRMMWLACKSKGIVGGVYEYPNRNSNTEERVRFEPLLQELGIKV